MKKWLKFFCLSFFSNKISKEGAKRGYTNFFMGLMFALLFLWIGFFGSDMWTLGAHYNNSPDFKSTVRAVLANADESKRISLEIEQKTIKASYRGGEYMQGLLVNTFESTTDMQNYSVNGYHVVIDTRPANTLAEIEAYCVSNDGKNTQITYQEYLTLSEVAKLNFDFKLKYTGKELELTDALVESYRAYVEGLSADNKLATQKLADELNQNAITKAEYDREIYQLYFTNYYPKITAYESTSKVPLLRNYYYHNYISKGEKKYLFIFDDYITGAFKTKSGIDISFYGFYSSLGNGVLIEDGTTQDRANALTDKFIKDSFNSVASLNLYAYAMNVINLVPFIALMPMAVALLAYSILKLRGVESINSFGAMFKIIGSYVWFSGLISALLSIIFAFFTGRNMIASLPLVFFFVTLAIRSIVFAIKEASIYLKQLEQLQQQEVGKTEV